MLNKADLLPAETRDKTVRAFVRKLGWKGKTFIISALTGEGCPALDYAIMDHLDETASDAESRTSAIHETWRQRTARCRA